MTEQRTTRRHPTRPVPGHDAASWDSDDPEIRALSQNIEFRETLRQAADHAEGEGIISLETMQAFRDLTPEDDAEGERLLAELECQTEDAATAEDRAHHHSASANGAAH